MTSVQRPVVCLAVVTRNSLASFGGGNNDRLLLLDEAMNSSAMKRPPTRAWQIKLAGWTKSHAAPMARALHARFGLNGS